MEIESDGQNRAILSQSSPKIVGMPSKPSTAKVLNKADIIVAGSVAIDLNCDFTVPPSGTTEPQLHVSNPAAVNQSIGGVGRNVALAAHRVSNEATVKFCSMIGDDM